MAPRRSKAMRSHLPDHTPVLDIIHVAEHLWEAANAVLGEHHPERTTSVATRLEHLLCRQAAAVITDLEERAQAAALTKAPQEVLRRTVGYY